MLNFDALVVWKSVSCLPQCSLSQGSKIWEGRLNTYCISRSVKSDWVHQRSGTTDAASDKISYESADLLSNLWIISEIHFHQNPCPEFLTSPECCTGRYPSMPPTHHAAAASFAAASTCGRNQYKFVTIKWSHDILYHPRAYPLGFRVSLWEWSHELGLQSKTKTYPLIFEIAHISQTPFPRENFQILGQLGALAEWLRI